MDFDPEKFIREATEEIKELTAGKKVLAAVSGGVDSVTAAFLTRQATGELRAVFLDTGLVRKNDIQIVQRLPFPVEVLEVSTFFFSALKGVTDSIEKRIVFRRPFWECLGEEMRKDQRSCLVLGTSEADRIETKRGQEQHNVPRGIDLEKLGIRTLVEPLRGLVKNQIREVAKVLGLPKECWSRMPFPGPGFAIRIKGEVTTERVAIVKRATEIIEEELEPLKPFQAFAVLLQDEAISAKDNNHLMGEVIVIRAVESADAITAIVPEVPWSILVKIRERITEEIPEVVKVLLDITPKPPSRIEWE